MKTLVLLGGVLASAFLLGACVSTGAAEEVPNVRGARGQGVVVESIGGWALEKAGIQAGDVLLSWRRLPNPPANPEAAEGVLTSYFDWLELQVEQAPRGTVVFRGRRDGEPKEFTVEPGLWEAEVRPGLPPAIEEIYSTGKAHLVFGDLEAAVRAWRPLADGARDEGDGDLQTWIALRIGKAWEKMGDSENAIESFHEAIEAAGSLQAQIAAWQALGEAHQRRSEFGAAEDAYASALEIRHKFHPEKLGISNILNKLGNVAWAGGKLDQAYDYYLRALRIREQLASQSLIMADSLNNLGLVAQERGELDQAQSYYLRALQIRKQLAPDSLDVAASLNNLGSVAAIRDNLTEAETYHRRALIIREKLAPNSLDSTSSFLNLGLVAWKRGDLTMAEAYYLRGLGILEKLAPDSLDVARCFNNLGLVAQSRGDFAKAEIYYRRDLAITEKLAPKSLYLAMSLVNLGVLAGVRGRFEEEESYYQRALVIFEKLAPKSAALAKCLTNLGVVAQVRGDLVVAEAYHLRAIALLKKQAPDSLDLANSFNNLGVIARARGDLATAERYHNRALAIRKQFTPESLVIATSLINLGTIAHVRDDPAAAETYYKRALSIQEKLAPDSLEPAHSFNNLGSIAEARGDLAVAETYYRRALRIQEKLAPNSLDAARSLNNLGSIAQTRGDLISALRYHRRALSLREKLAPNTTLQARTLHDIGTLVRKSYGARRAAYFLRRAVRALEGQMRRLGGSSGIRGSFRSQQELIYRDAVNVLLELERPDEAFHTLELYRARAFLELLAERDLLFSKDIPEELDRKRRWFAIRNDQLLQQMVEHPEGGEKLAESMRKLMQERNEIITEIRRKYPKLATLQYPQPLGLTEIQKHIDPGTAILSYNVGKEQTNLFVVTKKGGIEVYTLSLGQEELRRNVAGFLVEIERGRDSRTEFFTSMRSKGQRLYERLIQPVVDTLEASDRLLILPDGPLHYLPFDALIRPTGKNDSDSERHWQYLAEWKPLHVALSATVYAEIKKLRRLSTNSGSPLVAAFGDPSSSANSVQADGPRGVANVHVRAAVDSGLFNWDSLPYTREEVLQIADLHKNVQVYLGEGATEEKVKSIDRGVRILHFATHGHLDDYFPLNSALVLALPEGFPENRDNGLLQAWEIFESVRIDADLVVLSACQSALGKEQGGEGLIGLTRAFQYAGARSVVATLWSVADRATAELMVRFYQHLNAGEAKDHALQAAQIELIRGPIEVTNEDSEIEIRDYSAPYYWAGFQLYGDWQ